MNRSQSSNVNCDEHSDEAMNVNKITVVLQPKHGSSHRSVRGRRHHKSGNSANVRSQAPHSSTKKRRDRSGFLGKRFNFDFTASLRRLSLSDFDEECDDYVPAMAMANSKSKCEAQLPIPTTTEIEMAVENDEKEMEVVIPSNLLSANNTDIVSSLQRLSEKHEMDGNGERDVESEAINTAPRVVKQMEVATETESKSEAKLPCAWKIEISDDKNKKKQKMPAGLAKRLNRRFNAKMPAGTAKRLSKHFNLENKEKETLSMSTFGKSKRFV